jgi:hypothetical protein
LTFLRGSAGTRKTYTVRIILAELRKFNIPNLISATTGIAALQYSSDHIIHSLFSRGIDENKTGFTSHLGRGTEKAEE